MADKVGSVVLAKVSIESVDQYLTKYGLAADGTPGERVARLAAHQAAVPKVHLGDCTNCGGVCDVREPVCVFCGVGDDEAEAKPSDEPAPESAPRKRSERAKEKAPAKEKAKGKDKAPAKGPPMTPAGVTPLKDVLEASSAPTADSAIVATDVEVLPGTGKITVEDLNGNISRIASLKREAVVSYWRLGEAIYDNYHRKLYTQRTTENGAPLYKSFNQFVVAELRMSVAHAYNMMDVYAHFTETDVETYGVAKLQFVARLAEADRPGLLEKIRSENLSRAEVANEVRRLTASGRKSETAAARGGGRGFSGDAEKGRDAARDARSTVTVGIVIGTQTIQLMRADEPDKYAATIAHDPVGVEQHLNDVRTTYRVIKNEHGLALIVSRVRGDKKRPGSKGDASEVEAKPEKPAKPAKTEKPVKPAKTEKPAKPAKRSASSSGKGKKSRTSKSA